MGEEVGPSVRTTPPPLAVHEYRLRGLRSRSQSPVATAHDARALPDEICCTMWAINLSTALCICW